MGQHMPKLQSLSLDYVFISENLSTFITTHDNTLVSIRLNHCYSGWDEEEAICWGDFFSSIVSKEMRSLRVFDIAGSDLEKLQPKDKGDHDFDVASRAQQLREQFPGRRMLDYKTLDDKYGMVFDSEEKAFERFEIGNDHKSWEQLCKFIEENAENGS
jgi:hypothetical protein